LYQGRLRTQGAGLADWERSRQHWAPRSPDPPAERAAGGWRAGYGSPEWSPGARPSLLARTRSLAGRLLRPWSPGHGAAGGDPDADPDQPALPPYPTLGPRRSASFPRAGRPPAWLAELEGLDLGVRADLGGAVTDEQLERERDLPRGARRRASALPQRSLLDQASGAPGRAPPYVAEQQRGIDLTMQCSMDPVLGCLGTQRRSASFSPKPPLRACEGHANPNSNP